LQHFSSDGGRRRGRDLSGGGGETAREKERKRWHYATVRLLERGRKTKAREEERGKRAKPLK